MGLELALCPGSVPEDPWLETPRGAGGGGSLVDDRRSGELDESPREAPRSAPNADRPGEYRLAIRIVDGEIDPGDELRIEVYVVGYGKIRGSKVSLHPPPYFVDAEKSKVVSTMRKVENRLLWGGQEQRMDSEGLTIFMPGVQREMWEENTPYFDVYPHNEAAKNVLGIATIATEMKYGEAPIAMTLKVVDKAPTGTHTLQFFFTYFNGNEWKSDSQSVDVLVRNWVRRHEFATVLGGVLIGLIALLATILSLVFDVLSYVAEHGAPWMCV
jgi:hypothetical protein